MDHVTLRKVSSAHRSSTHDAIVVTLFRGDRDKICGWYLGPIRMSRESICLPYLARSKGARAAVAVVRALEEADDTGLEVCIVDPDDLWDAAWAA